MKLYIDPHSYIDTSEPIDISLALSASSKNPRAWYVDPPIMEPVRTEHYTGSIKAGGSVNFRNIFFNPHGHGTHTECLGHITREVHSVNNVLTQFFFRAKLVSILPKRVVQADNAVDFVVAPEQLDLENFEGEALIVRSLPNVGAKLQMNYSNTNPPYFDVACVQKLHAYGIDHLLIDLPSVDRESDGGALAFHHAFWEVPSNPNFKRTITEMIFVDNSIPDGEYVLELQMAPFVNDASPSRPVLYRIQKKS